MAYGIIKVDTVTFTDAGIDKSVSLSGLVQNPTFSGNVTVTGTLSGVTVTGTTASFTSGVFTSISCATVVLTSGVFASGTAAAPSVSVGTTSNGIYSPGTNQLALSTNGTGRLFVGSTGNVGVNTSSPLRNLHITGTSSAVAQLSTSSIACYQAFQNSNSTATNAVQIGAVGTDDFAVHTGNTGEKLRITSAGLVGIGTSAPNTNLEVVATKTISSVDSFGQLVVKTTSGATGNMLNIGVDESNSRSFIQSLTRGTSARNLLLNPYGGNVGIGTTSPVSLFHVEGTESGTGEGLVRIRNNYTTSGQPSWGIGITRQNNAVRALLLGSTDTSDAAIGVNGNYSTVFGKDVAGVWSEHARIDSSGRLLVGTSSDTSGGNGNALLQVVASGPGRILPGRSDGNTAAELTIGAVDFRSFAGSVWESVATITALSDGVSGSGDKPGRLTFSTTPDGSATPVERMRIASTGNVGIGTPSPQAKLHAVSADSAYNLGLSGQSKGLRVFHGPDWTTIDGVDNTLAASYQPLQIRASTTLFNNGTTESARIDSSGRLLVGTSSTSASCISLFQGFNGATTGEGIIYLARGAAPTTTQYLGAINFSDNNHSTSAQISARRDSGTWTTGVSQPSVLTFSTTADGASSPTERMRINNAGVHYMFASAGVLGIGSAAASGTSNVFISARHSATSITGGGTISFEVKTNGDVINTNGSYTAISDLKLKENIVDANSQWDDIKALQVRKYNFKPETNHQTHTQIGLIAQEVELISPGLVNESPDLDAEGNDLGTTTKSVNYSVLYMKAVKALQEAMERIELLEARLDAANL